MNFFSETKLESKYRSTEQKLKRAFRESRVGKVTRSDINSLRHSNRGFLYCNNRSSQLLWSKEISAQLSASFLSDEEAPPRKLFLVTVADISCAATLSGEDFDLGKIKTKSRRALRGLSYIGFIEPALYVNLQSGVSLTEKKCVFWHLHALVWGVSRKALKKRFSALNKSGTFRAICAGRHPLDARLIKPNELSHVVGYMLKPHDCAYRISRCDAIKDGKYVVSPDGEIKQTFRQGKSKLRMGERVRLFNATKKLHLDELAVSAGQGRQLLARAKRMVFAKLSEEIPVIRKRRRNIN